MGVSTADGRLEGECQVEGLLDWSLYVTVHILSPRS